MLRDTRRHPLLYLFLGYFAFRLWNQDYICSGPLFSKTGNQSIYNQQYKIRKNLHGNPSYRSVGNILILDKDHFELSGRNLERVDFDEFLVELLSVSANSSETVVNLLSSYPRCKITLFHLRRQHLQSCTNHPFQKNPLKPVRFGSISMPSAVPSRKLSRSIEMTNFLPVIVHQFHFRVGQY
jgi:hypothetical protein